MKRVLIFIILIVTTACNKDLTVMYTGTPEEAQSEIFALNHRVYTSGDVVRITGVKLESEMKIQIENQIVDLKIDQKGIASFILPKTEKTGPLDFQLLSSTLETLTTHSIFVSNEVSTIPMMDVDPGTVCAGTTYRTALNLKREGSRNCSAELPPCAEDGQAYCATSIQYPAVYKAGLENQKKLIRSLVSFAGIKGSLEECSVNGEIGCVAKGTSSVAILTAGAAAKIAAGQSLASITGSALASPVFCTAGGQANCVTTMAFPSVIQANLSAAVIKNGINLGPVTGNYPSALYPLASNTGVTDLTNFATQLTSNGTFEFFDSAGTVYSGSGTGDFLARNIRSPVAFENFGLVGTMPDILPRSPSPMTEVYSPGSPDRITLRWQNTGATGYIVLRKSGAPVDWIPSAGSSYAAGPQGTTTVLYVGTATSFVDTTIVTSLSYHYAVYSLNSDHFYSAKPARASDMLSYCAGATQGGTWVGVPGDLVYNSGDFCIMKYGAKDVGAVATSQASLTPWVFISQTTSEAKCAALGSAYSLVSNAEWMTLGANLALVPSNWSGGNVGSGNINKGHSDLNPSSICPASIDDQLGWVQTDCSAKDSTGDLWTQKRTHTLSTGAVIWDVSGNTWTWTKAFADRDHKAYDSTLGGPVGYFIEWTGVNTNLNYNPKYLLIPTNEYFPDWNDSWANAQGVGAYTSGPNTTGGQSIRGGSYQDTSVSGIFTLYLNFTPDMTPSHVGFRCVARP